MARVIFTGRVLAVGARELYQKVDAAQEQLFAYAYYMEHGDEQAADAAFQAFLAKGEIAVRARRELMAKRAELLEWRGKHA